MVGLYLVRQEVYVDLDVLCLLCNTKIEELTSHDYVQEGCHLGHEKPQ